ncbi:hypothetical protein [Haloferula sp. A504]|uniref:hypothetical protein n=1 Tax=Haloferula sp. A504 TaxID=3373601 RepID=UPI0031C5B9DC|nr:hypothetical protein [Verrucomicrobiaceae bacterium E54]
MDHRTCQPGTDERGRLHAGQEKLCDYNAARIAADAADLVRFVRESDWRALARSCFWLARQAEVQVEAERALALLDGKEEGDGRRG